MYLYLKTSHDNLYQGHTAAYEGDSGIDLYFPKSVTIGPKETKLIDLEICCEMISRTTPFVNTSYYLYPRSSIYKTPIRLCNSVGIIDANYRNSIKVAVDNIGDTTYTIQQNTKLFQLCAPNLEPINVVLTDKLSQTNRGSGFGSSGV